MGQMFRQDRNPIRFHMHGNTSGGSWLKGLSIHHTYARAVSVQNTSGLTIQV